MTPSIAVTTDCSELFVKAHQLAQQLQIPLEPTCKQFQWLLMLTPTHLAIQEIGQTRSKPIYVDFLKGHLAYRQKHSGIKQLLARAIGLKSRCKPLTVLDATAGFGGDAFILASLGCKVTLLERSPIIAALLADGLQRAQSSHQFAKIAMQLVVADAIDYLSNLSASTLPDVIYLDPMFPNLNKSALNKKTMRILSSIVGQDLDADKLFTVALKTNCKRVVVKRPRLAPYLNDLKTDLSLMGKSVRFDIYI